MLLKLRRCRSVWNDACIVLRESCVAGGGLPLEKWVDELVGEVRAGGSHLSYRSSFYHLCAATSSDRNDAAPHPRLSRWALGRRAASRFLLKCNWQARLPLGRRLPLELGGNPHCSMFAARKT